MVDYFNDSKGNVLSILEKKLNVQYLGLLQQLLEGEDVQVTGEQKKRIVNRCRNIFEDYIEKYEKNLSKLLQYIDKMNREPDKEIVKINQGYIEALKPSKSKKYKID